MRAFEELLQLRWISGLAHSSFSIPMYVTAFDSMYTDEINWGYYPPDRSIYKGLNLIRVELIKAIEW